MTTMNNNHEFHAPALSKSIGAVVLVTALILMVPLVAMQFTSEVDWDALDFMAAGTLLLVAGLVYVFASRMVRTPQQRMLVRVLVLGALFLMWAELAVGIFGSPIAGS
ncbi:MAG TPA: hypothetical protein VFT37_14880 [Telluria sp.]|nr:hypothetical protein [Telluria sp.]